MKKRDNTLAKRILWMLVLIFIYILGQRIMLPNFDARLAKAALSKITFFQVLGMTTGGSLQAPSLFSLGLGPYMTGMIVWQAVMALDLPALNRLSEQQQGVVNKFVAFAFAVIQAFEMTYASRAALIPYYLPGLDYNFSFAAAILYLVAGAMLAIELGEFNQSHGIGGTIALIIPGMLVGMPQALQNGWGRTHLTMTPSVVALTVALGLILLVFSVMVNDAEVRLPMARPMLANYATASYMPIRFLPASAMPFMFSSAIFTLPRQFLVGTDFGASHWGQIILHWTDYTRVEGVITYAVIIILLGYAFGYINVQPSRVARNMRNSGNYFYGIMPGDETEQFLNGHFFRISTISNLFLLAMGDGPLLVGLWIPAAANYSLLFGSEFIVVTMTVSIGWQIYALYIKNHNHLFDI